MKIRWRPSSPGPPGPGGGGGRARAQLCRRLEPLPAARLDGLVRAARLVALLVGGWARPRPVAAALALALAAGGLESAVIGWREKGFGALFASSPWRR